MVKTDKTLVSLVEAQLATVPRRLISDLIRRKIQESGVVMPADVEARLLDHFFSGKTEPFRWDGGPDASISLAITEDDLQEAKGKIKKILSLLPEAVNNASDRTADDILKRSNRQWPDERIHQFIEMEEFKDNLEARWGSALNALRLMLTISRQIGAEFHKSLRKGKPSVLRGVLSRLHIRSCQVVDEIIVLLETGHADGALARWRTLHEMTVVGTMLNEFGEEVAKRYVAHQAVEAKRANDEYAASSVLLGFSPLPKRDQARIEAGFKDVIAQYGASFGTPYGWAVPFLQAGTKPTFRDLEKAAGKSAMRSYYKMASHNVHAGPRGLFYTLSSIGNPSGLVAGASNAGLDEPGRLTALAFTQVIFLLFRAPFSLKDTINMKFLVKLRDQAIRAFERAGSKLERDEKTHQKKLAAKRSSRIQRKPSAKRSPTRRPRRDHIAES